MEQDDQELYERAKAALLREAKRGKERSETIGPQGWKSRRINVNGLRFFRRTVEEAAISRIDEINRNKSNPLSQSLASTSSNSKNNTHELCSESKKDNLKRRKKERCSANNSKMNSYKKIVMSLSIGNSCVAQAVKHLRSGGVIAAPTDTVYGLAVVLEHVEKLYSIKQRCSDKPVSLCFATVEQITKYANVTIPNQLLHSLLPGPCTLVFQRNDRLQSIVNPGFRSVGVRVFSQDALLTKVCNEIGDALALTSANLTNEENSLSVEDFENLYPHLSLVIDGGKISSTSPRQMSASTVVDLSHKGEYRIIRRGRKWQRVVDILSQPKYCLQEKID